MSIAVFGWGLELGSRVGARAEGSDCGVAGVQVEEKQRQMGLGLGTGNWSWELKRTMDRGHFCIFSNGIWKSCRRQRGSVRIIRRDSCRSSRMDTNTNLGF